MEKKDLAKLALKAFILTAALPAVGNAADATQETILAKGGCAGSGRPGSSCSAASSRQTPKFSACSASGSCSAATSPTTPASSSAAQSGQAGYNPSSSYNTPPSGYNQQGYNQNQGYGRPMERAADDANRPYGTRQNPNKDADYDETQQQQTPSSYYRTNPANPQNR